MPWKDGYYRLTGMTTNVFVVNGEKVHVEDVTNQGSDDDPMSNGTWKFGDFGDAPSQGGTNQRGSRKSRGSSDDI